MVIGERGPYVEFAKGDLNWDELSPRSFRFYFNEYRTKADNVMVYEQRLRVDYADYEVGMFYISPFDLSTPNGPAIVKDNRSMTLDRFQ